MPVSIQQQKARNASASSHTGLRTILSPVCFLLYSLPPPRHSSTSKNVSDVRLDNFQIIKPPNSPTEPGPRLQLWETRNKKLFMVTFVDSNISTEHQPGLATRENNNRRYNSIRPMTHLQSKSSKLNKNKMVEKLPTKLMI